MKSWRILVFLIPALFACSSNEGGASYYFDSIDGNDKNDGSSPEQALRSLSLLQEISLRPGDHVWLAAGQIFREPLILKNQRGGASDPIFISTFGNTENQLVAQLKVKGHLNGILLENCSFIELSNIDVTTSSDKNERLRTEKSMRCGILISNTKPGVFEHIYLSNMYVHDVFYQEEGYKRPTREVRTANGTQSYGWGIRVISAVEEAYLQDVKIERSLVENVAHTGIKFTGKRFSEGNSISDIQISNSKVVRTGGPGIQMSGVERGHIVSNEVDQSGSSDDSRKWGRGSGLWTWSSSDVLIEKNRFTNASGPGDSAGAHIDFNCSNIVMQYNFSANNAGGFCEILGNNYNCAYRYNISVNDGYRVKGVDGAFQEGKVFWLSGYTNGERKGPFNSYFYNNTIIVTQDIQAKVAIDRVADGVLITNNIFHIIGKAKAVKGDQYNPETDGKWNVNDVMFSNNLFLHSESWPKEVRLQDSNPYWGNAGFLQIGSSKLADYVPQNGELIKDKGMEISKLTNDSIGLVYGLKLEYDILGNELTDRPDLGAIEVQ